MLWTTTLSAASCWVLVTVLSSPLVAAGSIRRTVCPNGRHIASAPECCVFYELNDDLQTSVFEQLCNDDVQEILRLVFHDAIGYSKSKKYQGTGADGSILLFSDTELDDPSNLGIEDPISTLKPYLTKYNVTAGDLIQFAGAVGITNCPGAPRIPFLAGRPNAKIPASQGVIPGPEQSVDTIIARMADAGFSPEELVHLLAAHSIAHSNNLDPNVTLASLDSTPSVFDTQFHLEVLLKGEDYPGPGRQNRHVLGETESPLPNLNELRLLSDAAVARDNRTACEWQQMIDNQRLMMSKFSKAMAKLAVTGQRVSVLVDCSEAIPEPVPLRKAFTKYPAGKTFEDVEVACSQPFPILSSDP